MGEGEARLKYWEAVALLKEYIELGGADKEGIIEELDNDLE